MHTHFISNSSTTLGNRFDVSSLPLPLRWDGGNVFVMLPCSHHQVKESATTGLLFVIPVLSTDVDTLEVQFTVFRAPNNKLQFQQTSLFNGHVIFSCNSQTLTDQPRQAWVTHTFTQEELEERRMQCVDQHYEHFAWFKRIEKTINVSAGGWS